MDISLLVLHTKSYHQNPRVENFCGDAYNSTEIAAPEWYLQWNREIENWTQRSLALTTIPNSKVRTRVRLTRNTRSINFTKSEEFPIPRFILYRNT